MKLKPSLLLSTAAAVLTSMPLAANAQQVDFLTCVFGAMASGEVTLDGSDMTALISTLNSLCCKEGNDEAVCTAFSCVDSEVRNFVHQIIHCMQPLILLDTNYSSPYSCLYRQIQWSNHARVAKQWGHKRR